MTGNSYNSLSIRPRVEQTTTFTTGAIDANFAVTDSAMLKKVHVNATSPASATMLLRLFNSDDVEVARYGFDPSLEDDTSGITKCFTGWDLGEGGGTLTVTYTNVGDTVSSIVVTWEYDQK